MMQKEIDERRMDVNELIFSNGQMRLTLRFRLHSVINKNILRTDTQKTT